MRCIVPFCKHDSRRTSKSQGVTFHIFPTEPSLRSAWLRALGREGWEPRERSAVCSNHFLSEDLYTTRSGLRKVRAGAMPVVSQVCRICFVTDSRLYPMMVYKNLQQAYEILTGFSVESEAGLPGFLCAECARRLLNAVHFRTRSLRAHMILVEIQKEHECITLETIKSINRQQNLLTSDLGVTHHPADTYHLELVHEERDYPPALHEVPVEGIKCENEFQDVLDDKLKNEAHDDLGSVYGDAFVGKDYSSDDSLSLGRSQKPKRKWRTKKPAAEVPPPTKTMPTVPKVVCRRRKPFFNDDLNETLFTTSDLTVEEQLAEIEKRHETSNFKNSPFKCTVCYKGFLDAEAFSGHMMRHSDITLETIKSINRQQNLLSSDLVVTHHPPDTYHLELVHEERGYPPALHEVPVEGIKCEDEFQDVLDDNLKNEAHDDLGSVYGDAFVGKDHSSDDSLSLGRNQKPKRKRRTKKPAAEAPPPAEATPTVPKVVRGRRKPFLNDDLNETLFTISDLTVEEQLAEIEKRRETSNFKNSPFKCTVCYKGFLDAEAFSGHMMRHTDGCGEHECKICKTRFKHPHALRNHITAHHTQRFSCNQCPYVTTHSPAARLHERWHKGTKYRCPHCQEEFLKVTTYMSHVRIKHPSDFVCELCGNSFVSQKGIDLHKKLKHRLDNAQIPEDGPFCELCGVRFVSPEAHKRHLTVSAKHNTGDKQKEPKPQKLRKTRASRRSSRADRCDSGSKMYPALLPGPIPCEQCGLQLEDSRAYHGHFRRMHPDKNRTNYPSMKTPCMCEVCGKIFQSYALLKDHRWVHTGEKPFACDACGKAFRMRQRLVAHRRLHSQLRAAYTCALCDKTFSTHSNRQRHMFTHTGLKPIKCEMCGKAFKHAGDKRAHVKYVHLKKPWPKRARGKRRVERPDHTKADVLDEKVEFDKETEEL